VSPLIALSQIRVVLVRTRSPGNIGTVCRAIANHGLGALVLVDPPGFDPDIARWMAPEAHHILNEARFVATLEEALDGAAVVLGTSARRRRWDWPIYAPDALWSDALTALPAAIVFGPEDTGLSNEELTLCHALITIPTTEHKSLNLGQAVTVIAAALRGQQAASPPRQPGADARQHLAVVELLMEMLEHLSLIHICRRRRYAVARFRWAPGPVKTKEVK